MIEILDSDLEWVESALQMTRDALDVNQMVGGHDLYNEYMAWATIHRRLLAQRIGPRDLDRLILTRGYWSLRDSGPATLGNNLTEAVKLEIEAQKLAVDEAIAEVRSERQRWHGRNLDPTALVLDTGVVEHYAETLHSAEWHQMADIRPHRYVYIVVPRVVIDELDRHKQSRDQNARVRRARARAAIKSLWAMFGSKEMTTTYSKSGALELRGSIELLNDDIEHVQLDDPDAEILARGRALAPFVPVKVLTFDTGMALRGMASGVDMVLLTQPDDHD
jgi:hypothetical protein